MKCARSMLSPRHLCNFVCAAQGGTISALSSLIAEWSAHEPSPFDDEHAPSKHTPGYLTTSEVYERLHALVELGDLEHDETFTQEDVGRALHALYERQQTELQPQGMLSRQRLGIGRLWRIIPPAPGNATGATAGFAASHTLYSMINAEDAAMRTLAAEKLLEAMGELESLGALLEAIMVAAAPLPGSPIDFQLLFTAAHDALNEADDVAEQRRVDGDGDGPATPGRGGGQRRAAPASGATKGARRNPARHSPKRSARERAAAPPAAEDGDKQALPQDMEAADGLQQHLGLLLRKALATMLDSASEEDERLVLRAQREEITALACTVITRLQQANTQLKAQVASHLPTPYFLLPPSYFLFPTP